MLVVNGLYNDLYALPQALALIGPAPNVRATYATVQVNENAATLTGYPGRAALRDFVNAGGGLLVLGGNFSLGQGYFANTFLADLLPVTVAAIRDVQQASPPLTLRPAQAGLARALPGSYWKAAPVLYWRHRVAPKPEAQVQLLAGDEGVLFTGSFGKGRVAVFTGTVLGEPSGTEQPFWTWPGWPPLMRNTIGWLSKREPESQNGGG